MEGLFTIILERGMTASLLVLAVVLLRLVCKKMPKWFRLVLWGLVAFRLVCPFSFESAFSLVPDVSGISDALEEQVMQKEESVLQSKEENPADTGNVTVDATNGQAGDITNNTVQNTTQNISQDTTGADSAQDSSADSGAENPSADMTSVSTTVPPVIEPTAPEQTPLWQQIQQNPLPYFWLAGILLMALYGVVSYLKVKHQVMVSWNAKENIFYCDDIDTPFVFGLVKPGIYLPSGIEEATAEQVLRHEKEHLRRGDQWWKLLGFCLLAVYWFHPVLWVAYLLFCKDIEFACDERVIKGLEENDRREYAQALLQCSIGRRVVLFCPTAFGENSVKGRIRSVMTYKKATIPVLVAAVLLLVVVGAVFLTDRKYAYDIEREHLTLETDVLDEETAEKIAEDIARLMVKAGEGIYQLENFRFTFYELESEQNDNLLRVSVEADRISLRVPEDSPIIQGMKQAQAELTYEAERNYAQTMIDSMLAQLKQEAETAICEPAIFVTLNEKNYYELYYGDANRTPLEDYFKKENAEQEQLLGYLTVYQQAGIRPPMDAVGSSGYVYSKALKNPETEIYHSWSLYVFSPTLYYKEGVYSYLERYEAKEKSELPWELLGEELGDAYSNHAMYWSERDALTECTGNGTLYAIKGYEDSYRVALYYGKTTHNMVLLERMNDLWFHEGREVFGQRMHLENAVSVNGLSMEEELLWNFLAELYDATFIHPSSGSFPELNGVEYQSLKFRDALGFEHSIVLYEGGYVQETVNETELVVRIDEVLCRRVMERIETWEIEQFEVSFEQAIPVEAILNQEEDYKEVYEDILARVELLTTSKDRQFFGEEGCYISRVPIQHYNVSEEALNETATLILFSKDFSKAASMTLVRDEDGFYRVTLSYNWNSSIQKKMQARPEEEFIFLYSLKSGMTSSVMARGELMLDAQNEVCYAYPQGDYYLENNLYQKLYSDKLAVSYEELTAEENLIWISAEEGAAMAEAETLQPMVFGEDEVLKTMQLLLGEKEYTLQVSGNIPYYYWCWNPETEQFDYAFNFQITGMDEERQLLVASHYAGGIYDTAYFTDYYQVTADNKLELVESGTKIVPHNGYRGWQEAYLDLIYYFPNNLANPYVYPDYVRTDTKWYAKKKYMYLGLHDFDSDGTPELIMGDIASLAVFTYKNGNVEKLADIMMDCCWMGVSGVAFHDNTILISDHGSDGSGYVAWSYRDGAWTKAVYCEYHPKKCTINGETATYEEFCEAASFDPKDWEGSLRPYYIDMVKIVREEETLFLEQESGNVLLEDALDTLFWNKY